MRRPKDKSKGNFHYLHCQSKWIKKHFWTINHISITKINTIENAPQKERKGLHLSLTLCLQL